MVFIVEENTQTKEEKEFEAQSYFDFENSVHSEKNPMPEDELVLTRQGFTSSKDWGQFVEVNLPYLDIATQIALCLNENKEKRRAACITGAIWRSKWNAETLVRQTSRNYCKQPDCPVCQERKKKKTFNRLSEMDGMACVTVQADDLKEFTKDLSKDDYYRIPHNDGSFTFVLNKEHPDSIPLSFELKQELAKTIAESTIATRPSGSLGKTPSPIVESVTEPDEEEELVFKPEYDVKSMSTEIIFTAKSEIKTNHALDLAIYERIAKSININSFIYSPGRHSQLMDELNLTTEIICRENNIEYKVLSIETILVNADNIQWKEFKKRLESTSKTPLL